MSLREVGQSILIVAFLLSVAGTVEPSPWLHGFVAAFVITGFAVWLHNSDTDWAAGYEQGLYEGRLEERNYGMLARTRTEPDESGKLWKCGLDGCYCTRDPRFRECESD